MEPTPRRTLALVALGFEGGLAIFAIGLGWLVGQPAWADLHSSTGDAFLGVLACLPMLAGFAFCLTAPWPALRRLRDAADDLIRPLFAHATVFDLLWISALAGLGEELFFRGLVQALLCGWFGLWIGILAAS